MCWDGAGASTIGDCSSLRKYKEDIQDLTLGLETVLQLSPKTFYWKQTDPNNQKNPYQDLGFIAEEVEAINPLLTTHRDGALAGVRYEKLSAVFVNAIKEQQRELETQTVRLSQVEEDISGMVLELAQVKSDVAALQDEMASVSSRLAKVEQLAVSGEQLAQLTANPYLLTAFDIATISGDLKVLGQTDLAKTVIGGELTVGLLHFDDLKASISSLTGQVLIDGDLRVAGDATVSGQLRVEKGLVIPDSVTGENYCVRVASGAAVVVKGECQ
jgi:hypothetical protein